MSITLSKQTYSEALLDAFNVVICSAFLPAQQSLFHDLLRAVQEQNKVRLSTRLHKTLGLLLAIIKFRKGSGGRCLGGGGGGGLMRRRSCQREVPLKRRKGYISFSLVLQVHRRYGTSHSQSLIWCTRPTSGDLIGNLSNVHCQTSREKHSNSTEFVMHQCRYGVASH